MLLNPRQSRVVLQDALERGYALLAVNADSPAALTDCLEAAVRMQAPIIVETSLWQLTGHSFGAGDPLLGLARYIAQLAILANFDPYRDIPVLFHTDHIKGPETMRILSAAIRGIPIDFGGASASLRASTISLDSSAMSETENIQHIGALCRAAEEADVSVTLEMEAGVDDGLTPPEVTERLLGGVEILHPGRVWLWAPGVGTRHGLSDRGYPAFAPEAIQAQRELAKRITGRDIGIALHGSSGLAKESLRAAVQAGVVKVNWSSESLLIRSHAARDYYATHGDRLDPSHADFKGTAMDDGVQQYVSARFLSKLCDRISLLGGKGKAMGVRERLSTSGMWPIQ
jgi:fructose-bisphosphate aldolase class II